MIGSSGRVHFLAEKAQLIENKNGEHIVPVFVISEVLIIL